MNGNLGILISCFLFMVIVESVKVLKPEIERFDDGVGRVKYSGNSQSNHSNGRRRVDSTVYQTVNKYYCSLDSIIEGSHLMVYGSNGWTFPVQDVNLTLRYPPEDRAVQHFEFNFNGENMAAGDKDMIITGFKVILFIDGPNSIGYINEGGVLQEHISLSFISSRLTLLSYEFWVYGVRNNSSVVDLYSHYRLC